MARENVFYCPMWSFDLSEFALTLDYTIKFSLVRSLNTSTIDKGDIVPAESDRDLHPVGLQWFPALYHMYQWRKQGEADNQAKRSFSNALVVFISTFLTINLL